MKGLSANLKANYCTKKKIGGTYLRNKGIKESKKGFENEFLRNSLGKIFRRVFV